MLAALCLAMVFAISLSSYIALCYTSLTASTRNMAGAQSLDLAEAGIEQALYAANNNDWTNWTISGGNAYATGWTMTSNGLGAPATSPVALNFGNGTTGVVNITVNNYQSQNPSITSQGAVQLPNGSLTNPGAVTLLTRTLTCATPTAPFSASAPLFVNAVGATTGRVRFAAGGVVDSYNSDPPPHSGYVPYNPALPGYSAVIVSGDVSSGSSTVRLNNAVVKGYAVGFDSFSPTTTNWLSYASGGKIVGSSTPPSTFIDSSRILTTPVPCQPVFLEALPTSSTFPLPPSCGSGSILSLTSSLGSPAATMPIIYDANGINLSGAATVSIDGPVVLILHGSMTISGTAAITLTSSKSSLTIFAESGAVSLGGNGITNLSPLPLAKQVALLSTVNTNPVTFSQGSGSRYFGVIYFPRAHISVTSDASIFGSIVGSSVSFSGSPSVHYDAALRAPDSDIHDGAYSAVAAPKTFVFLSASVP